MMDDVAPKDFIWPIILCAKWRRRPRLRLTALFLFCVGLNKRLHFTLNNGAATDASISGQSMPAPFARLLNEIHRSVCNRTGPSSLNSIAVCFFDDFMPPEVFPPPPEYVASCWIFKLMKNQVLKFVAVYLRTSNVKLADSIFLITSLTFFFAPAEAPS